MLPLGRHWYPYRLTNGETPRHTLFWRMSQDGRAELRSSYNPIMVAWWLGWRAWNWLTITFWWPVLMFLDVTAILDIPDAVWFQWRYWRTFSLRPRTITKRQQARYRSTAQWDFTDAPIVTAASASNAVLYYQGQSNAK